MAEPQAASSKEVLIPDLTGTMVGRFVVRARLGAGGMGEVYRADDTRLKRSVALKRISPRLRSDLQYRQRFLREAERASSLNHHRIAGVYDVLEEREETFLVMEYVEGATLRDRLTAPFDLATFLPIAMQCAEALEAAHEQSIIHRDLKPENIMVTPKGGVKILDFGVAKRLPRPGGQEGSASTVSGAGEISGTPAYMAPEVLLEKEPDARADIFSLGVVYYEMLAGRHPFRAESFMATTDRILREAPAPLAELNPRVPARLEGLVESMLEKDPARRPASAAAVLNELHAFEGEARRPAVLPSFLRSSWHLHRRLALAAMLAVLLALGAAVGWRSPIRRWLGFIAVPEKKNLAVLPFNVVGGSTETTAFANGLTETLNARLTQTTERHPLQVVPASEIRAERVRTLEEARRAFGVNLVIEGSLQQIGDIVRVNYVLVDAHTRRQLRADVITAAMANPFAVEDHVVASVLDKLEVELQPVERAALATRGTSHSAAYDAYLRGRGYLQEYDKPENIASAIGLFNRALAEDPRYALAYAGLGEAYWLEYELSKDSQRAAQALAACERAVALDSGLSAAHECLGTVFGGTGKYERAVEEFQRAVALDPTSDDAYRGLGFGYERVGKLPEAEETFQHAISLRPHYWAGYNWLGAFYFRQARYAEAAKMFAQVVALAPDNSLGYRNLGGIYTLEGRYAEAIPMLERSVALRPTARAYSNLGTTFFTLRRFVEAAQAFEQAVKLDERDHVMWGNLGDAYNWIPGRSAEAASAYHKAIALAEEKVKVNSRDAALLGNLAVYHAMAKEQPPALANLRRAQALAPRDPEVAYFAALVHNQFGEDQKALADLAQALKTGFSPATIRDSPLFDNLRSNPRFKTLTDQPQAHDTR